VFVAASAERLLVSKRAALLTAACAPPAVTGELVHNAVPIRPPRGPMVKPEVHNISQRRQMMTKPRPQTTCTKNW